MQILVKTQHLLIKLLIVSVCALSFPSLAAEKAGFIIIAKGQVFGVDASGKERRLKRRSPIFQGDTVLTKAKSKAQIKLLDGAVMALQPATTIKFDEFTYQPEKGQEKSIFKLVEGGFRAITGAIGKKNPDDYRVDTPLASIGIRGTHYGVVLGETLSMAVWQGKIKIQNENGILNLGPDQPFSFGTVPKADAPPEGQLEPPAEVVEAFGQPETAEPIESSDDSDSKEQGQGEASEDTDTSEEQASSEEEKPAEQAGEESPPEGSPESDQEPEPGTETDSDVAAQDGGALDDGGQLGDEGGTEFVDGQEPSPEGEQLLPPPDSEFVEGEPLDGGDFGDGSLDNFGEQDPLIEEGTQDFYGDVGEQNLDSEIYPTEPSPTEETVGVNDQETTNLETTNEVDQTGTTEDLRLTDGEIAALDRVGVLVAATAGSPDGEFLSFAGGPASDGSNGNPIIVDYGALPESPDFDPTAPFSRTDIAQFVVRKGSAPFNSVSIINPDEIPFGLTAGVWRGDLSPVVVQVNPYDPADTELINESVFWVTGIPTHPDTINILEGNVTYDQVDFFAGEGSSGGLWDFDISFDVDFRTGDISNGSVVAKNGPSPNNSPFDKWQFSFSGQLVDVRFEFTNPVQGSLVKASGGTFAAEGDLGAFAADPEADFAAGAFRFWQSSNPGYFVTGIFGVHTDDDTLGFENRLSNTEMSNLNKAMHLVIDGNKQFGLSEFGKDGDAPIHIGRAANLVSGSPVLFSEDFDPFGVVFRKNTAPLGGFNFNSVPFVEWGYWDGSAATPVTIHTDPSSATNTGFVDRRVYWIYGDQTDPMTLPATGTFTYTDAGGALLGRAFDGDLSVGSGMSISVNFGNQTYSGNFNMTSNGGASTWNLNFNGGLDDTELFVNSITGTAIISGTTFNLDAAVDGSFVGTGAQGVMGAFKSIAKNDDAVFSEGVFFLQ